jgi:hypothetical protein
MCRALTVLCVAPDAETLASLKRAAVSASWELTPGATTLDEAMEQVADRKPYVLVVQGEWPGLAERAREALPWLRVVSVGRSDEADAMAPLEGVREAIMGLSSSPGGPVRS